MLYQQLRMRDMLRINFLTWRNEFHSREGMLSVNIRFGKMRRFFIRAADDVLTFSSMDRPVRGNCLRWRTVHRKQGRLTIHRDGVTSCASCRNLVQPFCMSCCQ
jgi:hypothetical protein